MAKLTKFTIGPSGELVYKSTGKLAPSNYIFRKNTVYKVGSDGVRRRVGSLSRNLTKAEASRISKAAKSRAQRQRTAQRKISQPSQGRPKRPSPTQPAAAGSMAYGEDWEAIDETEFPEQSRMVKEEFAQRVRAAAVSVAPESLKKKIEALSTDAICRAYEEDQFIFELYFRYHHAGEAPHTSDVSVWIYQFIKRIEQYMSVTE